MNKKNIISSFFVALLLTALWFYIYSDLNEGEVNQGDIATTTNSLVDNISLNTNEEDVLVDVISGGNLSQDEQPATTVVIRPIPDLDRKITFEEEFPEEGRLIMVERIGKVVKELKSDPTNISNWLDLGLQRKTISDYEGAKLAWEYAKLIDESYFVVRGNLGDIYAYYLGDNVRAEENYLKALELGSEHAYLYYKTAEFYRDFLLDNQKAKDIVNSGLEKIPDSSELQTLLETL
ncbi:MAG: hypothetical protein U9P50_01360 [Patescibacteria group bacterium]|nr:hypothetical protein [Patescibacteria group bacterium]